MYIQMSKITNVNGGDGYNQRTIKIRCVQEEGVKFYVETEVYKVGNAGQPDGEVKKRRTQVSGIVAAESLFDKIVRRRLDLGYKFFIVRNCIVKQDAQNTCVYVGNDASIVRPACLFNIVQFAHGYDAFVPPPEEAEGALEPDDSIYVPSAAEYMVNSMEAVPA